MLLELHGTLFRIAAQSEGKSTTCQGSRVSLAVTKAKRGCPHFLSCSHYWLKNRAVSSGKQCIDGCFSDFPSEIHSPIYAVSLVGDSPKPQIPQGGSNAQGAILTVWKPTEGTKSKSAFRSHRKK